MNKIPQGGGAMSAWTVTEHIESPFEKVGRIYIERENLVIRSELECRGFCIPLSDIPAVLDGDTRPVRVLESSEEAGTVHLSTSGRAMNITIEPFFYTTPLYSITRMLAGEQRKAPLFVGREQVEGGSQRKSICTEVADESR
jgi:hypothetical protein